MKEFEVDGLVELSEEEMALIEGGGWLSNLVAWTAGAAAGVCYTTLHVLELGWQSIAAGLGMPAPPMPDPQPSGGGSSW
jgi:hypothetical protein